MAAKSLLSSIGSGIKDVFKWLASPTGQRVISIGEVGLELAAPGLTGIINIANKWMAEIFKTEALAAGAASQTGSGPDKAAITITAVTPEILAFAKANGLPVPTADKIQKANDALVAFLNALDGKG